MGDGLCGFLHYLQACIYICVCAHARVRAYVCVCVCVAGGILWYSEIGDG
jgi:hypothetical protein